MRRISGITGRVGLYLAGVILVSVGIVSCVQSGLGISPISSIPYVLSQLTPWTLGELTMGFHLVNISIQYLMERKLLNVRLLLQIPVALLFSLTIDAIQRIWILSGGTPVSSAALLAISIISTALGMLLMLRMDLVQNPPDGTVRAIARSGGWTIGTTKIAYDCVCCAIALAVSLATSSGLVAFGIATIASACLVGRCLGVLQGLWDKHVGTVCQQEGV